MHICSKIVIVTLIILIYYMKQVNTLASGKLCYAFESQPYKFFASRTSYDEIRGFRVREVEFPGCYPLQFYFIGRHGTRYPKVDYIRKMRDRLPSIRDSIVVSSANRKVELCDVDLENLKNWHSHLSEDMTEKLTPTGESEMKATGMRFRIRFPSLFRTLSRRRKPDIRVIDSDRAKESARHFMMGLWGEESKLPRVSVDDHLLRFYKECRLWKNKVAMNHDALVEAVKFRKSNRMEKLIHDVSKRLGLKWKLSFSDIELIYEACRMEAAWDEDDISPWCAAFRSRELKVMEYAEDIQYYYKHGYGHHINYMQACPPVQDMIERFKSKTATNRTEPDVVIRFGNSAMFLKLLARLGLFRDGESLTNSNYRRQVHRLWRTSYINPFAANLAFILLDCKFDHRVATYFQEREMIIPGCSASPCPLSDFLHLFSNIADSCDINTICKI